MSRKQTVTLQPYPRETGGQLLSAASLFPRKKPPMDEAIIAQAVDEAFSRCIKNKKGLPKKAIDTPDKLVDACIRHLRERSDPILSSYFVSQCKAEDIFALDAVSHEMQRHCEYWGPGFIFPYVTGRSAYEIYAKAITRVADYIPFMTLKFRTECSILLKQKLNSLGLLNKDGTINIQSFLEFSVGGKGV